jgi:hypothetical protein
VARSGKDSINHPDGGHDDLINAAAGALVLAAGGEDVVLTWIKAFNPEALPRYLAKRSGEPPPQPVASPPEPEPEPEPPELVTPRRYPN